MITEGEAAIPLETTRRAFRNQSQSKQRSALVRKVFWLIFPEKKWCLEVNTPMFHKHKRSKINKLNQIMLFMHSPLRFEC